MGMHRDPNNQGTAVVDKLPGGMESVQEPGRTRHGKWVLVSRKLVAGPG